MSKDAKKFIDNWIAENISADVSDKTTHKELAKKYTFLCMKDAYAEGFTRVNLDYATVSLEHYMANALR